MQKHYTSGVEVRSQGNDRVVEGYALRWNKRAEDRAELFETRSIIVRGRVPVTMQHDRSRLVATHPEGAIFKEDSVGLHAKVTLPDTQDGRDAVKLIESGAIGGFSVGFQALEARMQDGVRRIQRALLGEVSLVDVPSYQNDLALRSQLKKIASEWEGYF